jgi:hypothetical protein
MLWPFRLLKTFSDNEIKGKLADIAKANFGSLPSNIYMSLGERYDS